MCVELSSNALRFKGKQASVKQVYHALRDLERTLQLPEIQNALDAKLAEYVFFPLTHVFNQAQSLSSTCVESAITSVIVLVSKGWRTSVAPEMARQLLLLMSLLAGGQGNASTPEPTDEVRTSAFECVGSIIEQLILKNGQLLNEIGSKNIVDQLAYLLIESITDRPSDNVQQAAADALTALVRATTDRTVLASLLPRTASALTKALRTSTKSRRTRKVLKTYLHLLAMLLKSVLGDEVVYAGPKSDVLDESWLRATAEQVKLALIQVVRLRSHEGREVRIALADLCFMILDDCPRSLSASVSLMLDTIVFIAQYDDVPGVKSRLDFLISSRPEISEVLQEKLYDWCMALPSTMQMSEDRPKEHIFGQITAALSAVARSSQVSTETIVRVADGITNGLVSAQQVRKQLPQSSVSTAMDLQTLDYSESFDAIVLDRPDESGSALQLSHLLDALSEQGCSGQLARACVDRLIDTPDQYQIYSAWLALQSLSRMNRGFDMDLMVAADPTSLSTSRPQLTSDLYAAVLPWLTADNLQNNGTGWQAVALAVECTVLQAGMLGTSYRPELLDTLYPIISLLGANNSALRNHAMTSLNMLANACEYSSTGDMLIANADYLINSVGMKLNAFDITPQAPQVLLMMIRLCGARIILQLDDLIGSMFSAIDNFHGYPQLVDMLFKVLKAVVDESKKQPRLAITNDMQKPDHLRAGKNISCLDDIIQDLRRRRSRKRELHADETAVPESAPHRPWKTDGTADTSEDQSPDQDGADPTASTAAEKTKLTKSYQLLLSIAQSTSPHLTSPSPRVRQTLLQLLDEVAPLLAYDENSFLPLINTVWPSVVPRLLSYQPSSEDTETTYNVCAAADVVATLCRGAGSFMSSRIDDLWPGLKRLFTDVAVGRTAVNATAIGTPLEVSSTMDDRTSRSQVLQALIRLLSAILLYVRLSDDVGDEMSLLLAPFTLSIGGTEVKKALQNYNADALWLWQQERSREIVAS